MMSMKSINHGSTDLWIVTMEKLLSALNSSILISSLMLLVLFVNINGTNAFQISTMLPTTTTTTSTKSTKSSTGIVRSSRSRSDNKRIHPTSSFSSSTASSYVLLSMAGSRGGGGMGMGSSSSSPTTTKKNTKGNKKEKNGRNNHNNNNNKQQQQSSTTPFDVNASLLRLEKKYEELMKEATKNLYSTDDEEEEDDDNNNDDDDNDMVTSEYIIATRAIGYNNMNDWIPIAQLCYTRSIQIASGKNDDDTKNLNAAISYYRRELYHTAVISSHIFQTIPRNVFEYSIETVDSFYKHVYDNIIISSSQSSSSSSPKPPTTKNDKKSSSSTSSTHNHHQHTIQQHSNHKMTKHEARKILQLNTGSSSSEDDVNDSLSSSLSSLSSTPIIDDIREIKRQYRKLAYQYHPDRFILSKSNDNNIHKNNDTNNNGIAAGDDNNDNVKQLQKDDPTLTFLQIRNAYETLTSGIVITNNNNNSSNGENGSSSISSSWYQSLGGKSRTDFIGPLSLIQSFDDAKYILDKSNCQTAICTIDPNLVQTFIVRCTTASNQQQQQYK